MATLKDYPNFRFFATGRGRVNNIPRGRGLPVTTRGRGSPVTDAHVPMCLCAPVWSGRDYSNETQFDLSPNPMGCDAEPCNQWLTAAQATAVRPGDHGDKSSAVPNTFLSDFSAVCFLTIRDIARMHTGKRPVALIQSAWGGTRVEAWMSSRAIRSAVASAGASPPARSKQNQRSVLYNAMVAPWNKFSVRAALWYQGQCMSGELGLSDA